LADGFVLKYLIAIHRKAYDADLSLMGIRDEKVSVYSQTKGYKDRSIFFGWLIDLFLPEVGRRRETMGFEGRAVLIINNYTSHTGFHIDAARAAQGIVLCPLPLHSSNQVQLLDVSPFGFTKWHIAVVNRTGLVNVQSTYIAQVIRSFMSAASPLNVVGTF
jgi:hypothetical protein